MTIPLQSRYFDEAELRAFGIGNVGTNVRVSEHATLVGLQNIHLGSNIRIDSHVVILSGRGTLTVGNNVHIEPASSIVAHFGVEIGNYCTISHGVRLFTASADYSGEYFTNVFPDGKYQVPKGGRITIHDHVIVGGNSVVMPGTEIGEGAAVGALSFVRYSIKGWAIYGGNPLKRIGDRTTHIRDLAARIEAENADRA
jgi:acetyltransferase-like isoleucine patch superfamily enzyme